MVYLIGLLITDAQLGVVLGVVLKIATILYVILKRCYDSRNELNAADRQARLVSSCQV